jgi:hypothetical protein
MSTLARTQLDPTIDRAWLVKEGGIVSYAEELDADGFWAYSAGNLDRVQDLIDNYPVRYLAKRLPEAKALIEQRAAHEFSLGFSPSEGPLAGHRLQVRDNEDRTNWLASSVAYAAAVAAGMGDQPGAVFRTMDNQTVVCTFAEGNAALLEMHQWGSAIMHRAWQLKDAALAASDIHELDAVLAELGNGWPSTTTAVEA